MANAGIPRIASQRGQRGLGRSERLPARRVGHRRHVPAARGAPRRGRDKIGLIRVDLAAASALKGFMESIYKGEATFPADIPVPAGTTDFSQFILAAQNAGAGGASLVLGEQEVIQVVRGRPAAWHRPQDRGEPRQLLARVDRRPRRLRQPDGLRSSSPPPTADVPGLRGAPRRPGGLGDEALQPENLQATAPCDRGSGSTRSQDDP